jgi:hypothetical protein
VRSAIRVGLIGLFALAIGAGVLAVRSSSGVAKKGPDAQAPGTPRTPGTNPGPDRLIPLFGNGFVEDSGFELALGFTPPVRDRGSLDEVREAVGGRAKRGIAALREQIDRLSPGDADRAQLEMMVGLLHMYAGEFREAEPWLDAVVDNTSLPPALRANVVALRGVAAFRRGEIENCIDCLGPSSCLFPIAPEAVHQRPEGARAGLRDFTAYLRERPDDLGVRWLVNVAAMTLGEYPGKVPPENLISLDRFRSAHDPGRFANVAPLVGLDSRGPNMLGGSVFDDFTGDGLPDVFVASNDCDLGASLYVNRGDGTFEDHGRAAGLAGQTLALNARQADFDNDGDLDVLLLRGGWEDPAPLSLLRNKGNGVFEDVTVSAGLAEPIATESAAWGDYDNDGRLDLYVAGEFRADRPRDPRNRCRLYHNEGGGKFVDVAARAGVQNERWAKGVAWGDYDGDGRIDLYVSNGHGANRLYHNNGDGTFTDVAERLGVTDPYDSFSCWFWDYDNDGRPDIFVAGFRATLHEYVSDLLGLPTKAERPRLYRNLGPDGFRDVTREAGLDRVWMTMGSNFADVDNDGYLDAYLGTGLTTYSSLVPNVMLKNVDGRRFEDVTVASGTGHLQKGHGVSFADWDGDGDLDLFVEIGGSVPGDRGHSALFQNPGHGRHWLALKLVGVTTNRSAIGAGVRVDFKDADGRTRSVHRVVGSGSSFGGNSLVVHVGLADARKAEAVTVTWPVGETAQTFHDVDADRTIEVTEGAARYRTLPTRRLNLPTAGR